MGMISLLLQNSAGQMSIGLAEGDCVLFDSTVDVDLNGSRSVESYVQAAFAYSGRTIVDVDCVFVDIGPGGLGATRTTVAFANAVGFAKSIPVIGMHAFELIGHHAAQSLQKPVVCIRPAARPNYYMALYDQGILSEFSFVDTAVAKAFVRRHQATADFAGKFSFTEVDGVSEAAWPVSTINSASIGSFLRVALDKYAKGVRSTRVYPISENLSAKTL